MEAIHKKTLIRTGIIMLGLVIVGYCLRTYTAVASTPLTHQLAAQAVAANYMMAAAKEDALKNGHALSSQDLEEARIYGAAIASAGNERLSANATTMTDSSPQAGKELEVSVQKVQARFKLRDEAGNTQVNFLTYILEGPTITLNSNKAAAAKLKTELYDDTTQLIAASSCDVRLQEGIQIISCNGYDATPIAIHNPGEYHLIIKITSGDKVLYSNQVNNLLAGCESVPLARSVKIIPTALKIRHNHANHYLYSQIKIINTGNCNLAGFIKIEPYLNGQLLRKSVFYINQHNVLEFPGNACFVLTTSDGSNFAISSQSEKECDAIACLKRSDVEGKTLKIKISFVEVDPDSNSVKPEVSSVSTPEFVIPVSRN